MSKQRKKEGIRNSGLDINTVRARDLLKKEKPVLSIERTTMLDFLLGALIGLLVGLIIGKYFV